MLRHSVNRFRVLVVAFAAITAHASEVTITGGRITGSELPTGGTFFSNIPYAAPPVGDLRWKPPAPPESWQGTRDGTLRSTPCLQLSQGWNEIATQASNEDC